MKTLLKWIGYILGGLMGIILIALGVVYVLTALRMNRTYSATAEAVAVPADSASIERGHHLVVAVGKCTNCHGDNLAGKSVVDDAAFATIWSTNLTRGEGGIGRSYSDVDFVRAIRYGVRGDGKPLIFMPSDAFTHFSDADLGAIIAYVRSVAAVDQTNPRPRIGPIARVVSTTTKDFPLIPAENIDRGGQRPATVLIGVTREYGDYLIATGGCKNCHNPNLSGGTKIEGIATANLTPAGIASWSEADFFKALRTGVRPDGRILSAIMPWPYTKNLTDDEIRAMWLYVHSLPARPTGG